MASPQPNFARTASSCAHGKFAPLYRINAAGRSGIGSLSAQRRANWLVGITIIALVATLVGPRMSELLSHAKFKTAKIQMESFETALDLYYLDNGSFPAADEGLKALVQRPVRRLAWNGPAFEELARRWKPILDVHEEQGGDVCFELHPGEDLFDGVTFERFLDKLGGHKRCCINYDPSHFRLQALDYVGFIDVYHERIKAFHVKDAEFRPSPKQGVYSGFAEWPHRAGRFRSLGDGDIDFGAIFASLSVYGYDSWAVLEWECAIKNRMDGAREGAEFIERHLIEVSRLSFEDFIDQGADRAAVDRALGIES